MNTPPVGFHQRPQVPTAGRRPRVRTQAVPPEVHAARAFFTLAGCPDDFGDWRHLGGARPRRADAGGGPRHHHLAPLARLRLAARRGRRRARAVGRHVAGWLLGQAARLGRRLAAR